ncbi:MAG: porin family protein [Pseudomonadota bacterium]|nr:porin family protein [Pseudomonadota bacterium]
MTHTKSFALALATLSGGLLATAAQAQDMYKSGVGGLYAGLNYTFMNAEIGRYDADTGTLSGKVGVMATPFLGIEARAGFGADDDTINGVDVSVDNFYGGYATFNLANESMVTPYAVLGFTRVEAEVGSVEDDDSDVSYGIGANMEFAPNLSGNLEYMRYYDDDNVQLDGLSVGIQLNF